MAVTVRGDRGAFGAVVTPPQASPLRLGALAARAASSALLSVDGNGDVKAGALVAADLPSAFTRRDVAETINASWTWAAGQTVGFAAGGPLAPPLATSRSTGTRLIVYPVAASTEFALGVDAGTFWSSVPANTRFAWHQGATERLRLDTDGTVKVINGTGGILLDAAGTGSGSLVASASLQIHAVSGGITLQTGQGRIVPTLGYRESLGELSRKYLALHAAELWVETLVAQQTLATIGGRILVGPTTTLTRDCAPGDTTIYVKHNSLKLHASGVEFGSKLLLERAGQLECMAVTSTTPPTVTAQGDYAYVVFRALGGAASQWYAGDALFDTGRALAPAGTFIDVYSVQGINPGSTAGPTIVGNLRTGDTAFAWAERWAVGDLKGIYGNAGSVFGAAFGNPAGIHLQVDATNGIRMLNATGVSSGHWDMAGNLSLGYTTAGQLTFTQADGYVRLKWNSVDRMVLDNTGTLQLYTGLVAGALAGSTGVVRSAGATAWNAGQGFLFQHVKDTGVTTALIGNSLGRRLQWDGASLKIVSDGLTIDENGITMQSHASGAMTPAKAIQWSGGGGYLWDSSVNNSFELYRGAGSILLTAPGGTLVFQGGGAGTDRAVLTIAAQSFTFGGIVVPGAKPVIKPDTDVLMDLGTTAQRFRAAHITTVNATAFLGTGGTNQVRTTYAAFGGATPNAYYLEVGADYAGKPTSSTWTVTPSNRAAKDDVTPVDPVAALALVRRVPLVRFRYNGALGSHAGERGIGVIAEDMAAIMPDSVKPDMLGERLGWNAHELLMLNVAAVQALAARLDAIERTTP